MASEHGDMKEPLLHIGSGPSANNLERTSSDVISSGPPQSEPETTNVLNLFCAWSIGFLTSIEGTVSTPSLWLYVQSLGGSKTYYTVSIMMFPLGRLAMMGVFGMWTDRRNFKEVFVISLLVSMSSGMLYAAAPTVGLGAIPVARAVLGAMSCQTVATQAFVSQNTAPDVRTRYMSINNVVTSGLNICGPAFNLFIVMMPCFDIPLGNRKVVFNSYTWVGWFLFTCQLVCMVFILLCFKEPKVRKFRKADPLQGWRHYVTFGGFFPWGRLWVDPWLRETKAWVMFAVNLRNQFTNFAVTWIIPIIAVRDYGFNQLQNSCIFVGLALESVVASLLVAALSERSIAECIQWIKDKALGGSPVTAAGSAAGVTDTTAWRGSHAAATAGGGTRQRHGWSDRDSLCLFQAVSFAGLLIYVIVSRFGTAAIPLWLFIVLLVWYDFGAPASQTQSLYSKMIGPGGQGLYFSVFQSNGAVGRILAGQATRLSFAYFGMPFLWVTVFALWSAQWYVYFRHWDDLSPDGIEENHKVLAAAKAKRKPKAKAKTAPVDP